MTGAKQDDRRRKVEMCEVGCCVVEVVDWILFLKEKREREKREEGEIVSKS